jgi:hypothetical protein
MLCSVMARTSRVVVDQAVLGPWAADRQQVGHRDIAGKMRWARLPQSS